MPSGGRRPGAGRPKATSKLVKPDAIKAAPAARTAPPGVSVLEFEVQDPAFLLGLVAQGEMTLPSGAEITGTMIAAAKELLPYYKAKLSTTNKLAETRGPPEELTIVELKYERTRLIQELAEAQAQIAALDRALADAGAGRGSRIDPESGGEGEFFELLHEGFGALGPDAGETPSPDDFGIGEG